MASIVDPASDSKSEPPECATCGKRQWPVIHSCTGVRQTTPPREFGPGHPYWPCPICAGLRPSSVSPLIRAKHIEHTMVEPVVDEDDFRLACRLVHDWRKNSDGSDPELIDRITMVIGVIRSGGDA